MIKTNKQNDIDTLLDDLGISLNIEKTELKLRKNGLLLSDEQIAILNNHNINYEQYQTLESLIFRIEEYINDVQGYMVVLLVHHMIVLLMILV